jgi:hypothetical protein
MMLHSIGVRRASTDRMRASAVVAADADTESDTVASMRA